ncbi:Phage protein [Yersinia phage fPS-9]|nr:Phage protein [Yersinia phage fPS-9]SOL37547.1 Phage protein [Yersinia phage fPS-9]
MERVPHSVKVQEAFNKRLKAVLEADGTDSEIAKRLRLDVRWVRKARRGSLSMHVK